MTINTEKIWKTGLMIKDGQLHFTDVHSVETPVELVSRYEWDRIIRMDIPERMETWFMSKDRITLDAFWNGWAAFKEFALPNGKQVADAYNLQHQQFLKNVEEKC